MATAYRTQPSDDSADDAGRRGHGPALSPPPREDLPFKIELWDRSETILLRVLAVASSAAIGYAMYYAAIEHYSDATLILRRNDRVLSRWSLTSH